MSDEIPTPPQKQPVEAKAFGGTYLDFDKELIGESMPKPKVPLSAAKQEASKKRYSSLRQAFRSAKARKPAPVTLPKIGGK